MGEGILAEAQHLSRPRLGPTASEEYYGLPASPHLTDPPSPQPVDPPKISVGEGIVADENFVAENWDSDED